MNKDLTFNKQAVVSYSGGLDSTCLMLHLLSQGYKVNAYSFDYGQAHSVEIERAKHNTGFLKELGFPVNHQVINVRDVFSGDTSTLVNHEKSPEGDYRDETMKCTVVNNRNVIFSSIIFAKALSLAKRDNSKVLISLGVHAGDHCFTKDTQILTPNGFRTIETLKIWDPIFSLNPETQQISIDTCLDIIPKGFNSEIYNIKTTTGSIRLTSEHEVYVCNFDDYNKSKGYIKSIGKKKVKELRIGDYMITSNNIPNYKQKGSDTINIMKIFENIDHHEVFVENDKFGFIRDNESKTITYPINVPVSSLVQLMAWYITEGWTHISTKSSVSKYTSCFSQSMYKNLENCEDIQQILKNLSIPLSVTESKQIECGRPKEVTYQFNSVISALMKSCGCSSKEKHIPDWLKQILFNNQDARKDFITTMVNGDGHYDEFSGMYSYQSNSHQLISDMCELIKLCGSYVKVGRTNKSSNTITINWGSKFKKQGLIKLGDSAITKITNIEINKEQEEPVYDISVKENHNFFAGEFGNVLISNSIYPDCTEESVNMARELFRISNWDSELVDYYTPFVNISKDGVLKQGLDAMQVLGLSQEEQNHILSNTISCYNATPDGLSCGKCGTCVERLEAFRNNGIEDPASYVK